MSCSTFLVRLREDKLDYRFCSKVLMKVWVSSMLAFAKFQSICLNTSVRLQAIMSSFFNMVTICFEKISELLSTWNGCVKRITLCNCRCSYSYSPFSASRVSDFRIVDRTPEFWKSLNMAEGDGEFSFFRGIHKNWYKNWYLIFPIRPMTTKFGKQVPAE